jgi:3'-5' exoribonuclease
MRYLADVKEGDQIVDIYLCADKQNLKTRAGKSYYSVRIQDKSGIGDGKIWDLTDGINDFKTGDYIKIDAAAISFQGSTQYNIRRVRVAQEGEYDPKDYIPSSAFNIEDMYKEFVGFIDEMEDEWLNQLATNFFVEDKAFVKIFKMHTAAKSVHHAYMGGLLEHTLGMLRLCKFMAAQYPVLNKSLLYAGCMFHDIGKLKELSEFPIIEYTDEGQLVGHIIIGIEWLTQKINEIPKFPATLANLLKHMIIAHHGELAYGSPKKPELIEAIALHYIDNMDAKMKTFSSLMESNDNQEDWLGYQRMFETNLRRTRY